jgi:hypothetical protein
MLLNSSAVQITPDHSLEWCQKLYPVGACKIFKRRCIVWFDINQSYKGQCRCFHSLRKVGIHHILLVRRFNIFTFQSCLGYQDLGCLASKQSCWHRTRPCNNHISCVAMPCIVQSLSLTSTWVSRSALIAFLTYDCLHSFSTSLSRIQRMLCYAILPLRMDNCTHYHSCCSRS